MQPYSSHSLMHVIVLVLILVLYVKAVESGDKMFIIQSTALDVLYVSNMLV